jgi:hypothetical protein
MRGIFNSGGAIGADHAWGTAGAACGYHVRHFSFPGHKRQGGEGQEVVVLSHEQLDAAEVDEALHRANRTIGRRVPPLASGSGKLLRRNYWQQTDARAIYAVATLDADGMIEGGTAWAVQMFIDRHEPGVPLPIYLFEQNRGVWLTWGGAVFVEMGEKPPVPEGIVAAIGTRDINERGAQAITELLA